LDKISLCFSFLHCSTANPTRLIALSQNQMKHLQLLELPDEAIVCIIEFMGLKDVAAMSQTCQHLNAICEEDHVWRGIASRLFSVPMEEIPDFGVKRFVSEFSNMSWSLARRNTTLTCVNPKVLIAPAAVSGGLAIIFQFFRPFSL
jgi:hypothetical protein